MRALTSPSRASLVVGLLMTAACARPPVAAPSVDARSQLAAAEALLRDGCFDCMVEALQQFRAVAAVPNLSAASAAGAADGVVRAALLLDVRARELGFTDDGYRQQALDAAGANGALSARFAETLALLETVRWRIPEVHPLATEEQARLAEQARDHRDVWLEALESQASTSAFAAYVWLAFNCSSGQSAGGIDVLHGAVGAQADTPLVAYKQAICPTVEVPSLTRVLDREPRFVEVNYYLALDQLFRGRLDDADARLRQAYDWRPRWPAVTLGLANLAVTGEDFTTALRFYNETLALVSDHRDARFGQIRSLSSLGRHEEAIAAADVVLAGTWYRGEGFYWRAWNEAQLGRDDEAWADIDRAWRLWVDGDVAKVYGILALRRRDLETALGMLRESRRLKPADCEVLYYLGLTHADRREWEATVSASGEAASCLESRRAAITAEVAQLRVMDIPETRRTRQVAAREREYGVAGRMLATAWYNTAAGSFNLARLDEARDYASRLVDDEQFGERARDILSRLLR